MRFSFILVAAFIGFMPAPRAAEAPAVPPGILKVFEYAHYSKQIKLCEQIGAVSSDFFDTTMSVTKQLIIAEKLTPNQFSTALSMADELMATYDLPKFVQLPDDQKITDCQELQQFGTTTLGIGGPTGIDTMDINES